MATLDLYGNYAEQILSLYLWDQITPPDPSELADDKWIRPYDATSTVEVSASSYMAMVGGHLFVAKNLGS